jgi:hypothetical protein
VPARADDVLVTTTEFNSRGEAYKTIDPAGREDRVVFDHAGRQTKTIQNYFDGDPTSGNLDADVTVEYTYLAGGQIKTIKARQTNTGSWAIVSAHAFPCSVNSGPEWSAVRAENAI